MLIDREKFFTSIRNSLFNGVLTQSQVDGMNYLLDTWEHYFVDKRHSLARLRAGDGVP